jgi:CubicO group peptidase (beta-lactamase class C family)
MGFDRQRLDSAVAVARDLEINTGTDLAAMLPKGDRHPNNRPLGPLKPRGRPSGVVCRGGYIIAEYGDVSASEVTFSVTKSYVSACAGLAFDAGLIGDLDDPVGRTVTDGGFASVHNRAITWRQLLQQTSEWEGELFGIPEWIDRGRTVAERSSETVGGSASRADNVRPLTQPGTFWEYNDVRVNRAALALLRIFGQPLPKILSDRIMIPIQASTDWQWHGYTTSWVEVDGHKVQSVSGGAHWGGGLWISTLDQVRFGLLFLRRGLWADQRILSDKWIDLSLTPCTIRSDYGLLWWLNHGGSIAKRGSPAAFAARGAGGNIIYVEPARDLVIVLRWCQNPGRVLDEILSALN